MSVDIPVDGKDATPIVGRDTNVSCVVRDTGSISSHAVTVTSLRARIVEDTEYDAEILDTYRSSLADGDESVSIRWWW